MLFYNQTDGGVYAIEVHNFVASALRRVSGGDPAAHSQAGGLGAGGAKWQSIKAALAEREFAFFLKLKAQSMSYLLGGEPVHKPITNRDQKKDRFPAAFVASTTEAQIPRCSGGKICGIVGGGGGGARLACAARRSMT